MLAGVTGAIQAGFIAGTLSFALLAVSDRFSPSRVFFICSLLAATANLAISIKGLSTYSLIALRASTGFFLAGIYPVGMKIAADHFERGLGKSLGYLVGALVVGTALPHLLRGISPTFAWRAVVYATSGLSVAGGLLLLVAVPDGPFRKKGRPLRMADLRQAFINPAFRSAAFGYFGHMWELYAFWAFLPIMLGTITGLADPAGPKISIWSFAIIAVGGPACVLSGLLSARHNPKKIAAIALGISLTCSLASPAFLGGAAESLLIPFLLIWGMAVVADSPMFSTMVARNVPAELSGSAMTLVNCIGFSITIVSIACLNALSELVPGQYLYCLLAPGPACGLLALLKRY